jgi:lysyl-tRNA synthetase class 2
MSRVRIASLRPGVAEVAGRVLRVDTAARRIVLADASGQLELTCPGKAALPEAGEHCAAQIRVDLGGAVTEQLERLERYRGAAPFPSPGGEFYRLHRGARARNLELRARALAAVRAFFAEREFLEVQTPCRVRHPGLEPHLRPLEAGDGWYLITSPEYHLKRLLAGGLERIYSLGPCWRGDELGHQHLSEFCMLEWYHAYLPIDGLMRECEELVAAVARATLGTTSLRYQGLPLELAPPFLRLPVGDAFRRAGVEPTSDAAELARRAEAAGLGPFADAEPYEAVASRILVERVEPALRGDRPVFLHAFPAPLAALSRLSPQDPTVAERFELYAGGLELANAFGELGDPEEQRRRLREDQRARRAAGQPQYELDERFLAALAEGIPPSSGIALGVDRLIMLLCDSAEIGETVAFAPDEI